MQRLILLNIKNTKKLLRISGEHLPTPFEICKTIQENRIYIDDNNMINRILKAELNIYAEHIELYAEINF